MTLHTASCSSCVAGGAGESLDWEEEESASSPLDSLPPAATSASCWGVLDAAGGGPPLILARLASLAADVWSLACRSGGSERAGQRISSCNRP